MANVKISNLTPASTPLTGAEQVPVVQSGATVRTTVTDIIASRVSAVTASSPLASSGGVTPNLSLTGIVPVANGGTGSSSTTYCSLAANVFGTLPIANGGTGSTSATYCSLTANVSGILPVVNGGTGQSSYTDGQLLIGNSSGNTLGKATLTAGTGITITNGAGSITIASTAGSGGAQDYIVMSYGIV